MVKKYSKEKEKELCEKCGKKMVRMDVLFGVCTSCYIKGDKNHLEA